MSQYLGDLNKTSIIDSLFRVPFENRDAAWRAQFFSNVAEASFRCGEPQVMRGPDGFDYFTLYIPEPGKPFQCFVLRQMKDDFLLQHGLGVVINPQPERPQWVFSYGDIVGLHRWNGFIPPDQAPSPPTGHSKEVITKEEKVIIGSPSDDFLPQETRQVIKKFLQDHGLKEPRILLMQRDSKSAGKPELVFALDAEELGGKEQLKQIFERLSWFLPRTFPFAAMSGKDSLKDHFQLL